MSNRVSRLLLAVVVVTGGAAGVVYWWQHVATGGSPPTVTAGPLAAAAPADPEGAAREWCEQRLEQLAGHDNPFGMRVLAALPSEAGDAAAAHEHQRGNGFRSPLRDRDPGEFVAACFFEADAFGLPSPPPPGRPLPPGVHTRVLDVVLADGEALGLAVGGAEDVRPGPLPQGDRS